VLIKRIDELSAKVGGKATSTAAKKTPAKKAAAKKPAAKRAVRKAV
jgi:hypothetical protein